MSLTDILLRGARNAKLPQSFQPLLQQALSEAAVRYEPQYDALNQLRAQSAQTMRQNTAQANSAAQLISALANESQRNLNANTNPVIQRASQYSGAPGVAGQVGTGLALSLGGANSLLAQAAANAPIRANQQGIQALAQHQQDLGKINAQRSSLEGQAGTFVTGRFGDLVTTDRSNRAKVSAQKRQLANALKTAGVDSSGQVIPGGPKDPAITHPPKPPAAPSTIAKPPANYPGSAADWNNASRADRQRWLTNHPTSRSGTGGAKPTLPPAKATTYESQARQVADILLHPPSLQGGGTATREQIISEIRAGKSPLGKGIDPRIINIGSSLASNKGAGLGPWGAGQARSIGLDPNRFGRPLPKPKRTSPIGPAGPAIS